jgi:hypothetical protein
MEVRNSGELPWILDLMTPAAAILAVNGVIAQPHPNNPGAASREAAPILPHLNPTQGIDTVEAY